MLQTFFKNYDEFKARFGTPKNRKNRVLLALIKSPIAWKEKHLLQINNYDNLSDAIRCMGGNFDGANTLTLELPELYGWHTNLFQSDEFRGVCVDGDANSIRYVNAETGKVYKMKASKFIAKLLREPGVLPEAVANYFAEEWARKWISARSRECYNLHIDDNFRAIYDSSECVGDFHSCMTGKGFDSFYQCVKGAKAAYLRDSDNYIVARAIIFKAEDESGKLWRLLERQYSSNGSELLKNILIAKCVEAGAIDGYKRVGAGCSDSSAFVGVDGVNLSGKSFAIKFNTSIIDEYISYQDSFKWYDDNERKAYNEEFSDAIRLDITEGRMELNYDEYHGRYTSNEVVEVFVRGYATTCDEEDMGNFRYIDDIDEWHHVDDVAYDDIEDRYILDKYAVMLADGCVTHHDNAVVCEECGEWYLLDEVEELDGAYYCLSCYEEIQQEQEEQEEQQQQYETI